MKTNKQKLLDKWVLSLYGDIKTSKPIKEDDNKLVIAHIIITGSKSKAHHVK